MLLFPLKRENTKIQLFFYCAKKCEFLSGQTHEIFKNHHDINKVAQVVNRCFRVGLKKSTI
jgi:hypothetical protein